jgi:arsenite methyltransferase
MIGIAPKGHNRTHQSHEGKKGSHRSRAPFPSYHYGVIFRSRPFLTNDGTPRMTILNYHRCDVMAVETEPPIPVDVNALREDVKSKYREVAIDPHGKYHFHTGRYLAKHLGYDDEFVASLPDVAVESFAGVANPFSLQTLAKGEHVVDVGSGGGFDSFVAVHQVGAGGKVIGVDMTEEMLAKSRSTASALGLSNVEFREGLAEHLPVEDNWADVVISNGVINLCADKRAVFSEIWRVLRPGGRLQFGDIANGKPVPEAALKNVDLWTA